MYFKSYQSSMTCQFLKMEDQLAITHLRKGLIVAPDQFDGCSARFPLVAFEGRQNVEYKIAFEKPHDGVVMGCDAIICYNIASVSPDTVDAEENQFPQRHAVSAREPRQFCPKDVL